MYNIICTIYVQYMYNNAKPGATYKYTRTASLVRNQATSQKWVCQGLVIALTTRSQSTPQLQPPAQPSSSNAVILSAVQTGSPECLPKTVVQIQLNGKVHANCLIDTGSSVAFFSRTLNKHGKAHASVEKEACAIVEALKKWKHFLSRHFTLITDQEPVSFMFDRRKRTKNEKWRMELSCFDFDVIHRPGRFNVAADALSSQVNQVARCFVE